MSFDLISTALFAALKKEGSKTCFFCISRNTKLILYRFIKSLLFFQLGRNSHSNEKRSPQLSFQSKR